MSENVLSKVRQGDECEVSSNLEQELDNIDVSIVPEIPTAHNERLEDFLPKALMLLIRTFRLSDPNITHRWKL